MTSTPCVTCSADQPTSKSVRPDGPLVQAAQSGSSAAFAELYGLYERRIYRTIFSITQNREDAEDALQDAFLRAYRSINSFEGRAPFHSWLTAIAINSALMVLRKRRRRAESPLGLPHGYELRPESTPLEIRDTSPDPEQGYHYKQAHNLLIRAIHKLRPPLRVVVEERMTQNSSARELAGRLGISEAAVKSRLYRARRRLTSAGVYGDIV
jgi:RNA polymerase sigma-70 factor (ECF subfamily)